MDARTGERHWQASVDAPARTPWVQEDTVYVPTGSSIHALATAGGTPKWHVETAEQADILTAPHGVSYIAGRSDPTLVTLAPDDGSERWRADVDDPWAATLFAGGEHVFVSSGTHDSVPWIFAADTGEFVGDRQPREGADFAAEQFALDGVVYAADGFFGNVRAEEFTTGGYDLRWKSGIDAYNGFALAGGAGQLYVQAAAGDEPGLYGLSMDDGAQAWHNETVDASLGRPVVADEAVVVLTPDALRCFDPADGRERWRYASADIGRQFVLADDLVFTTAGETLRALRAT